MKSISGCTLHEYFVNAERRIRDIRIYYPLLCKSRIIQHSCRLGFFQVGNWSKILLHFFATPHQWRKNENIGAGDTEKSEIDRFCVYDRQERRFSSLEFHYYAFCNNRWAVFHKRHSNNYLFSTKSCEAWKVTIVLSRYCCELIRRRGCRVPCTATLCNSLEGSSSDWLSFELQVKCWIV